MSKNLQKLLVKIENGSFYKNFSGKTRKYVFSNPIEQFHICSHENTPTFWGVTGPCKSDFLKILASKYYSDPPLARTYPHLLEKGHVKPIQFMDFRDNSGLDKCHMAARYEAYSFKGKLEMDEDVNSLLNFVTGANNYNQNLNGNIDKELTEKLLAEFDLSLSKHKWINALSNGQMRRARIAKAIHAKPQLLVIDDPFLGLDPKATLLVSDAIRKLALDLNISIVLGLRTQEEVPIWIKKLAFVNETGLSAIDEDFSMKKDSSTTKFAKPIHKDISAFREIPSPSPESAFIEFTDASVVYKGVPVLLKFSWKIERGTTWRILGENGSGKTTILSLITAEHPQSWKSFLSIDGIVRKPGSGVNYFDINNKIGISSPELHAVAPFNMKFRSLVLNGLVRDVGNSNFRVFYKNAELPPNASSILHYFKPEMDEHGNTPFCELPVSLQKLALFMRAVIKSPEILILDEAFSGMEEQLVAKCHLFIEKQLSQTTIFVIGHLDWEVPSHEFVLRLNGGSELSYNFFALIKEDE
ncbi:P-loop containing nucleoside triphosphate hydrolase protein [Metschnikowia bicuspidata var. bicuspidata NRRL YB-4993]|uniref:p-loop containing nucleoside triphosphate hydrolase protein n=1 Tax=Metschnikowia bicuspidata var. bicuspidata NRRL YB-4993 TaxID=869754 RepID=A0A1A0HB34_9ASCO|nr:P-loop containing nucleoside triphosphate hydrolase protein [Metschnikowia bicuspidata var. bicuspidata NRRL YB-4993]OBA21200.1 P-loop containing nucleoside triphosphate hydrolase protein [Metschnikowia bicuspidata var. bicuspidata NRRL YB-4993]